MNFDEWLPFLRRYGPWGAAAVVVVVAARYFFTSTSQVFTTELPFSEKIVYLMVAFGVMAVATSFGLAIIAGPVCYSRLNSNTSDKGDNDRDSDV